MSLFDVLGAPPMGARLERMRASSNFSGGRAQNLVPTSMGPNANMVSAMGDYLAGGQTPKVELPLERPVFGAAQALSVTWLGHSTMVMDVDGVRFLTDPVLSQRVAPTQWAGPARFHPAPVAADGLPEVDAVLISHDHYDHLDHGTILRLTARGFRFITALGVGAHLEAWGVPADRITELDWWESTRVGQVEVHLTPSRHFSGRGPTDRNRTLWGSFALRGPSHSAWFSGDTGPFDEVALIAQRLGPFDLTCIEIGAFHPAWGNIHLGPEQAERMHRLLGGGVMMPVHWGTFSLAPHRWDAPIVELLEHAERHGTRLMVPVAGQTVQPARPSVHPFWLERAALAQPLVAAPA